MKLQTEFFRKLLSGFLSNYLYPGYSYSDDSHQNYSTCSFMKLTFSKDDINSSKNEQTKRKVSKLKEQTIWIPGIFR
jgi:hypothetical protein